MRRREFLKSAAGVVAGAGAFRGVRGFAAQGAAPEGESRTAGGVFLDLHRIRKWDDSNGDTWDPFWADDGALYAFNCDGRGFGQNGMNLAFNKLEGNSLATLRGTQVNPMAEYGKGGEKRADNATWKACGQECIDGVFYAFVSRNVYGSDSHDPLTRQLALNASLIKSTDRGRTWVRSAEDNYRKPMWPGASFGAPFFVHYGRNGGDVDRDGAREYVYACSTNGFWNDGDRLILGRVRRALLPRLESGDWEYLAEAEGGSAAAWSKDMAQAHPILSRPGKCGQTPITYVPELKSYLLVSWYNTETMTKWFEPNAMRYDFYQAPHPWGPWVQIESQDDSFLPPTFHMYGPSICAQFQQRRGADVEVALFTAGCPFDDVPGSPYKMWMIPMVLEAEARPSFRFVSASDPEIKYKGAWFPWATTRAEVSRATPMAVQGKGAQAEFSFSGTGVEYVAEKAAGMGEVDVFVDGQPQGSTSLRIDDFPALYGVCAYSKLGMKTDRHSLRLVARGDALINLSGLRVYA